MSFAETSTYAPEKKPEPYVEMGSLIFGGAAIAVNLLANGLAMGALLEFQNKQQHGLFEIFCILGKLTIGALYSSVRVGFLAKPSVNQLNLGEYET